jgi:hypothetical protein
MKRVVKLFFIGLSALLGLLGVTIVIFFSLMDEGGIFSPNPYVATEFAHHCTPQKFKLITVGMSQDEVEQLIGKPLYYSDAGPQITPKLVIEASYARKNRSWSRIISWKSHDIYYDSCHVVIGKSSRWWDESTSFTPLPVTGVQYTFCGGPAYRELDAGWTALFRRSITICRQ